MNARRCWLLAIGIGTGFASLAGGREAYGEFIVGATATAFVNAEGPFTGQQVETGPTQAYASRADDYGGPFPYTYKTAYANARVDAGGYPVLNLEGLVQASNYGATIGGTLARSTSQFADLISLRPRTAEAFEFVKAHPTMPMGKLMVTATAKFADSVLTNDPKNPFDPRGGGGPDKRFELISRMDIVINGDPTHNLTVVFDTRSTTHQGSFDDKTDAIFHGWTEHSIKGDGIPGSVENADFSGTGAFIIAYDSKRQGYAYTLQSILQATAFRGFASLDSQHSVSLVGFTFADGTTPESHGFDVVTASGIPSPNARPAAVPEPSTLIIAIAGLGGLGLTRRLRSDSPPTRVRSH